AVLGRLDDAERAGHDVPGRAVVLLQLDHGRVGEIAPEPAHDADVGAAPAVDALVVVADHAQVPRGGRERAYQPVLDLVHVLELVGEDVAEAAADLAAGEALGVLGEAEDGEQDVVEVDGVRLAEAALVLLEAAAEDGPDERLALDVGGALALLLGGVDARED